MLMVRIMFTEDWLDSIRKLDLPAILVIQTWINSKTPCTFLAFKSPAMFVKCSDEDYDDFKKSFRSMFTKTFKVSKPSSVYSIDSLKVPYNFDEKLLAKLDESKDESTEDDPRVSPVARVLKEHLDEPPFKYISELSDFMKETAMVVPMLQKMASMRSFWNQSLLVSMDDGYGMTEFLQSLCQLYAALGIASEGLGRVPMPYEMRVEYKPQEQDIYASWDIAVNKAIEMNLENDSFSGLNPILCLDISAWQNKLLTDEVRKFLRKLNVYSSNFTLVFKIPFVEARALKAVGEALGDIFSIRSLVIPPLPLENLVEYAKNQLESRRFSLVDDAVKSVEKMILQEKRDSSFFGFKTVDKLVDRIIYEKAKSNCLAKKFDRKILQSDIASCVYDDPTQEKDPNVKLMELVGLGSVKDKVHEIVAQINAYKRLPKDKKRRVKRPSIHMLFTGNPGTGKTTVARIVAEIFHEEGILSKGHLIEVRGRDLCGEWIGTTAPKTSAICRDAYGSVLFIDEAYTLFKGDKSSRDYGPEALATLIAEMENHRYDMCVILAGYTDEMETMITGNPGLKSRIPYQIDFPNYSREDLVRIFFAMANASGFKYEKALETAVRNFFNKIPEAVISAKTFSNARFVRNLYERTWGKAACRSSLESGELTLLATDLLGAAEDAEFKQLMETKTHRSMGFGG